MKIFITGPSGSGKTTLARDLSKLLSIPFYCTDQFLFEYNSDKKKLVRFPDEKVRRLVKETTLITDWIIEGGHLFDEVFSKADFIVWLRLPLATVLFRQWRRFFSDPKQRREHGFIGNLKLSKDIITKHFLGIDRKRETHTKYSHRSLRLKRKLEENELLLIDKSMRAEDLLKLTLNYLS